MPLAKVRPRDTVVPARGHDLDEALRKPSLTAITPSLTAGTHSLTASTHSQPDRQYSASLTTSTHSLTASTHSLTAGTHSLTATTHSLTATTHSLTTSTHSLTASTHSLTASTHSLTASTHPRQAALCALSSEVFIGALLDGSLRLWCVRGGEGGRRGVCVCVCAGGEGGEGGRSRAASTPVDGTRGRWGHGAFLSRRVCARAGERRVRVSNCMDLCGCERSFARPKRAKRQARLLHRLRWRPHVLDNDLRHHLNRDLPICVAVRRPPNTTRSSRRRAHSLPL